MTMLLCPLCGKKTHIDQFDPENFADDIFVQEIKGLGRGKGFKVTEVTSIFDNSNDDTIWMIKERVLQLAKILKDEGELEVWEIAGELLRSEIIFLINKISKTIREKPETWMSQKDEDDLFRALNSGLNRLIKKYRNTLSERIGYIDELLNQTEKDT